MIGLTTWLTHRLIRQVRPHWIRNALALPLAEVETFAPPRVVERLPGLRMLVLAPHPDDESLGCGGVITKHVAAGGALRVVYLTDGSLGDRALRSLSPDDPVRVEAGRRLGERRRAEARAAMDILGVRDYVFLDGTDGALGAENEALVAKLGEIVRTFAPEVILLPFPTDKHRDHAAASACLLRALEPLGLARSADLLWAGYEVWATIYPNTLVDITDQVERKRAAINQYRSQLEQLDYVTGTLALNQFRAISGLLSGGYAEAFYLAPMKVLSHFQRRLKL